MNHAVLNTAVTIKEERIYIQSISPHNLINLDDFKADNRFAGIDGTGQAIVIIDTGIDLDHPAFGPDKNHDGISDRIVYSYDFAGEDFYKGTNDADATDHNGHGSHVSSIVGSSDPKYLGIAPNVDIIALKVFSDKNNSGKLSDLEEALDWVLDNHKQYNVASINMSLSTGDHYNIPQTLYSIGDELTQLEKAGVITVAAAGNSYQPSKQQGIGYPAAHPSVISVGAVDNFDNLASFSQRSTAILDIFAPGVKILGAGTNGNQIMRQGTSMASPVVAGTVAIAQQLAEDTIGRRLSTDEFQSLLQSSGKTIYDKADKNSAYKRLDIHQLAQDILAMGKPNHHPPIPEIKQIGEVDSLVVGEQWVRVNFADSYENPVIILSVGKDGIDPVTPRLKNLTSDGFFVRLNEPSKNYAKGHVLEDLSYLVIEEGIHTLSSGDRIQAQSLEKITGDPKNIQFTGFESTPTVLSQIQSNSQSGWKTTRLDSLSPSGANIRTQTEELLKVNRPESVGVIAIESKDSSQSDFVTGIGELNNTSIIKSNFDTLFAQLTTTRGLDPANLRVDYLGSSFQISLQEERSFDSEIAHCSEGFNYLSLNEGPLYAA